MKIAFRHVPFHQKQIDTLTNLVTEAGHEALWLSDAVPTVKDLADCEVLMGYFPTELFQELPKLKWLQTPCAGVERFCGDLYASSDVTLTNCSGAFGTAISEYIFAGLLMQMRLMPAYLENQKQHIWHCEGICRSIAGSTITVAGTGDIGSNFAKRAKAFGAYIKGVRKTAGPVPDYFDQIYTTDQLNLAVQNSDAVVLALPGTNATTGLISGECISHMSSRTILVNCGRGRTVDQDALTEALAKGRLAGAVLDVLTVEPLPSDHPLWDMKNVIITPHISGHDDDPVNSELIYSIFESNLKHYLAGEPLEHVVDRTAGY